MLDSCHTNQCAFLGAGYYHIERYSKLAIRLMSLIVVYKNLK